MSAMEDTKAVPPHDLLRLRPILQSFSQVPSPPLFSYFLHFFFYLTVILTFYAYLVIHTAETFCILLLVAYTCIRMWFVVMKSELIYCFMFVIQVI